MSDKKNIHTQHYASKLSPIDVGAYGKQAKKKTL